jgi:HlyD family secretion protein
VALAKVDAARSDLTLLRGQVPIGIVSASAELAASEAQLEQARAEEAQAARDKARATNLRASGGIDEQTKERAILAHDAALQSLSAARAARDKASAALQSARLGPTRIKAREAELAALAAAARQAQALIDEAQTVLADLTIVSPAAGTVTTRFVEVGQVVAAGTPMLQVVDLDRLHLKAFVPEADVGKLHVGSVARVYTDAYPDRPSAATVRYVASRAEFTPKELQTRDERVKLVYAVRLYVEDNRDRRLVPGLGADAIVRQREDVPWLPPR